jgi:CRP-like cAMP-binding protein
MDQAQIQRVHAIIEKVRVFHRLTVTEAQKLLSVCEYKTYPKRETIYEAGKPGDEMLILVQGRLLVTSASGTVLGRIDPGTTVGEMGVLTGLPRTANVIVEEAAAGFVIKRKGLAGVFMGDEKLKLKIFENLVPILCERLVEADGKIETLSKKEA